MRALFKISLVLLLFTAKCFAWGADGHSMVAEVAFQYADQKSKDKVLRILDGMTIEQAADWMDKVKNQQPYLYLKTLHYGDMRRGTNEFESSENIVTELDRVLGELDHQNTLSKDQLKLDVLIIFHLLGDIHQPLHIGYADDKGGNLVKVNFFGHESNLHSVWDEEIIKRQNIVVNDVIAQNHFSAAQLQQIKTINPKAWAIETKQYVDGAYTFTNGTIDQTYLDKSVPVIEAQILKAGIRLAAVLDKYFKD